MDDLSLKRLKRKFPLFKDELLAGKDLYNLVNTPKIVELPLQNQVIKIIELLQQDKLRVDALDCVYQLNLPDCYLAAGFVRNMVWDHLHNKTNPTPLNDMDVIYFDANEVDDQAYLKYETQLKQQMPEVNWQVRNQAKMNERNGDSAYLSSLDAMRFWPEKETAVAIRKTTKQGKGSFDNHTYECISAFGFDSLFNLQITHNPQRELSVFQTRVSTKNWLQQWPMLTLSTRSRC